LNMKGKVVTTTKTAPVTTPSNDKTKGKSGKRRLMEEDLEASASNWNITVVFDTPEDLDEFIQELSADETDVKLKEQGILSVDKSSVQIQTIRIYECSDGRTSETYITDCYSCAAVRGYWIALFLPLLLAAC